MVDSGAYSVQPKFGAPPCMKSEDSSMKKANGRIQKLKLLSLGSAMSGAPIIRETIQFARPHEGPGMTAPNTMTRPCRVTIWL